MPERGVGPSELAASTHENEEEVMAAGLRLLVLGVALSASGCGDNTPKVPEVRSVRTLVVDPKPIDDDRRAVGEIRPRYESDIGFRVAGKIIARNVDVGDVVKEGGTLARLHERDNHHKMKSAGARTPAPPARLTRPP